MVSASLSDGVARRLSSSEITARGSNGGSGGRHGSAGSDVGRTMSEEAANQRAVLVRIVTTHKSHLAIANRTLKDRLRKRPVPVSQHSRRFHPKDPMVRAAASSFISATEDLAEKCFEQLSECNDALLRAEADITDDREELVVFYETGVVGWIDCLFSIIENANGLLSTKTIADLLMRLVTVWVRDNSVPPPLSFYPRPFRRRTTLCFLHTLD